MLFFLRSFRIANAEEKASLDFPAARCLEGSAREEQTVSIGRELWHPGNGLCRSPLLPSFLPSEMWKIFPVVQIQHPFYYWSKVSSERPQADQENYFESGKATISVLKHYWLTELESNPEESGRGNVFAQLGSIMGQLLHHFDRFWLPLPIR